MASLKRIQSNTFQLFQCQTKHLPSLFSGMNRNTRHGDSRFMRILRSAVAVLMGAGFHASRSQSVSLGVATAADVGAARSGRAGVDVMCVADGCNFCSTWWRCVFTFAGAFLVCMSASVFADDNSGGLINGCVCTRYHFYWCSTRTSDTKKN